MYRSLQSSRPRLWVLQMLWQFWDLLHMHLRLRVSHLACSLSSGLAAFRLHRIPNAESQLPCQAGTLHYFRSSQFSKHTKQSFLYSLGSEPVVQKDKFKNCLFMRGKNPCPQYWNKAQSFVHSCCIIAVPLMVIVNVSVDVSNIGNFPQFGLVENAAFVQLVLSTAQNES